MSLTTKSLNQFAVEFTASSREIGIANRDATKAAALAYKKALLVAATTDTGGDLRLSHWGWTGTKYRRPKLGAGYEVFGEAHAKAVVSPRPYGLWAFLEGGAKEHRIILRRRRKKRALAFAGGEFAKSANHPGVRGKKTFSRGAKLGERAATKAFIEVHKRSLARAAKK